MTRLPHSNRQAVAAIPHKPFEEDAGREFGLEALQHQYLLQVQGGRLYPEHIPVNTMQRVLDVGCGSGQWVFELARRYPRLHVYGIDTDDETLQQANMRRNASSLPHVEFRKMDLLQPFPIPNKYLDFVHMRNCRRFIFPAQWPDIIQKCVHLLKAGGWLTAVEMEFGEISSPSFMALQRASAQAMNGIGRGMDPDGLTVGVAARLYGMLLKASLEDVTYDLHTIDLGFMGYNNARLFLSGMLQQAFLIRPIVVQQEILTSSQFGELVARARIELQAPDLCGWALLISAYGRRGEM